MKYEYGEPLQQSAGFSEQINRIDGRVFANFSDEAERHRVIACINACAGLSNEQLEKIGLGGVAKMMAERDQLNLGHALDNRVIAHLQGSLNERKTGSAGPPLTAEQAAVWEWTGEQPRRLGEGESGIRSHCDRANCCEPGDIIKSFPAVESHSFYWPLRRRQQPKPDESPDPQNATLNDIAGLLNRIVEILLDRLPEGGRG